MLDQITKVIEQVSSQEGSSKGIASDLMGALSKETSDSIISGFKGAVTGGNIGQITDLFQGKTSSIASNPMVLGMISSLISNLTGKLGLENGVSSNFANAAVPKALELLVSKAKDSSDSSFNVTDLVSSLSGGADSKGLLDSLGGALGLDQNKDGKLGLDDAMSAIKGLFK